MAFQLYVTVDNTTTQLNDGAPFRLESAEGLSSAGVQRLGQRGPLQNGVTDLGFRLRPRDITLNLIFTATDDATLDSYRDQLMNVFNPLEAIEFLLSVQRDDGGIRSLTCFTTDEISIVLAPELRPGHTHRATVQLRAAYPLYLDSSATAGSASYNQWWLAGGAIGTATALEASAVEFPAAGFSKSIRGTDLTEDWAVAFVTSRDTATTGDVDHFLWGDANYFSFRRRLFGGLYTYYIGTVGVGQTGLSTTWPGSTTANFHVIELRSEAFYWRYWNGTGLSTHASVGTTDVTLDRIFTWRDDPLNGIPDAEWLPSMPKSVVLVAPTENQLGSLAPYMLGLAQGSISLVNNGDVPAYPIMTLQGPIYDPVIVNQTTGQTIDLSGGTILQGNTWTIDLNGGDKHIYDQNGNNVLGSVSTTPVSMADFAIAPHPTVTGGTNAIVLTHSAAGTAATFTVQFINEYMSF